MRELLIEREKQRKRRKRERDRSKEKNDKKIVEERRIKRDIEDR